MKHTQQLPTADVLFYSLNQIELLSRSAHFSTLQEVVQDWTLIIITQGNGILFADGARFPLKKGTGFILVPGTGSDMRCDGEGLTFYKLSFEMIGKTESGYGRIQSSIGNSLVQHGMVTFHPFSHCALLLESLYFNRGDNGDIQRLTSHIRFQELLLLCQQSSAENQDALKRAAVERSIDFINHHYNEVLTVDQLAAMVQINRSRYTQLFREITGQLPLDYLNGVRIERAQQLLLMSDDRLHDIAQTVGYSNEYYFNRRFKGTVGVTPGQYRRTHQGNIRVFAPFLEDYLLALDIIPVAQYSHAQWGKQEYLGLHQVPHFDISSGHWAQLSQYEPDLILLDEGYRRWKLEDCRHIAPLFKLPCMAEDWRATLRTIASIFGKSGKVDKVIQSYEQKAAAAREILRRSVCQATVACLRISSCGIYLYGGQQLGYTGGVLYKDLGLTPHPLVDKLTVGQRRISLTDEWIAQLDADHLFITFDKREGEGRELLDTSLWNQLPAVQQGHVYEVDFIAWMNYGVLSHKRKIDDVLAVLA
ncbi:helix-turn-helix domain-containing protein [Paenibacillus taiwanensis]|uniref:helix-turn-helix domain-containing protein n=1 Tax=Paenibacillus taiwanensis TaxID=401638 RepID=UPI001FE1FF0A|nr:helix-turn-helix domain-containing protein [Paenibacillus taiwanensis]